jgi:hypothetical protein
MRNIEHTHGVSDGLMFVHNAGVLHRHEPPAEWDHSRTETHVFVVQGRLFLCGLAHASILDFEESGASIGTRAFSLCAQRAFSRLKENRSGDLFDAQTWKSVFHFREAHALSRAIGGASPTNFFD